MSDNYQQFSEEIADITPEEEAWLCTALVAPEDEEARRVWEGQLGFQASDEFEFWPDFGHEFEIAHEGDRKNTKRLWVYSEQWGNLENLAQVIHKFLQRFRRDYTFELGYAQYSDKLRVSEFYGGVLIITAAKVHWSEDAVTKMREEVHKEVGSLAPGTRVADGRLIRGNRSNV